jgi:hypothetical protein
MQLALRAVVPFMMQLALRAVVPFILMLLIGVKMIQVFDFIF